MWLFDPLCFILLLMGVGFIFKLLRIVYDKAVHVTWNPIVEKGGGLLFGFMRSFLVASVILMILALLPLPYMQHSIRDRSRVGMHFLRIVPDIYGKVSWLLPTFRSAEQDAGRRDIVRDLIADKSVAAK
jgi:hypothetical protein